jgi:hypothetical protein
MHLIKTDTIERLVVLKDDYQPHKAFGWFVNNQLYTYGYLSEEILVSELEKLLERKYTIVEEVKLPTIKNLNGWTKHIVGGPHDADIYENANSVLVYDIVNGLLEECFWDQNDGVWCDAESMGPYRRTTFTHWKNIN